MAEDNLFDDVALTRRYTRAQPISTALAAVMELIAVNLRFPTEMIFGDRYIENIEKHR